MCTLGARMATISRDDSYDYPHAGLWAFDGICLYGYEFGWYVHNFFLELQEVIKSVLIEKDGM